MESLEYKSLARYLSNELCIALTGEETMEELEDIYNELSIEDE
jgi:hypothetical protein